MRCVALRGSQTRPVKAIPEICAMAQSSSHRVRSPAFRWRCPTYSRRTSLSSFVSDFAGTWPLVLAFEIRTGRRELQRGEFVAIMPYIGDNPLTNASREPLWLGKGGDMICSGGRSCDSHRIQWLQHTTFKGSSCWVECS